MLFGEPTWIERLRSILLIMHRYSYSFTSWLTKSTPLILTRKNNNNNNNNNNDNKNKQKQTNKQTYKKTKTTKQKKNRKQKTKTKKKQVSRMWLGLKWAGNCV